MQELILIDSIQGIEELKQYLLGKEYVAYDCETTGLSKSSEIIGFSLCAEEGRAYYVVLAKWNTFNSKLEYPDYREAAVELILSLKTKCLIMHNSVFDCMMAESYFGINLMPSIHTDTMILAHLLDENRRVGLKELAYSMYGESSNAEAKELKLSIEQNGGTTTKNSYELYKADSYIIGKYGAKDALLTFKLFTDLVPELYEQGLDTFFYDEESMPLLRGPTYDMNVTGLQVDSNELLQLKKTLEAECAEAKAFILQEIDRHVKIKYPGTNKRNQFNIGASQQLSWLMFGALELEFSLLTKAGKEVCKALNLRLPYTFSAKREFIHECLRRKDEVWFPEATVNGKLVKAKKIKDVWAYIACDKKTLQKFTKFKWVEKLLEYQKKLKILNTYVKGIESRTQYGVIQPSFLQHGTTSGRYSSRNPNFQNLPRDDKRIKGCIKARPNKVYVGADYSQLEPRVFAFFSKDERLLSAFKTEDDFYSVIGMEVYGKTDCIPRKDGSLDAFGVKYKKLRDLSKVIALASTYGATPHQLAPTTGKSIEDTANDINNYFDTFPGVRDMMLESHRIAKTEGLVKNYFGRPRRIPDAKKIIKLWGNQKHADLPYEARNMLNLAVNHRIQSTAASIVNRAAIVFYTNCKIAGIECQIVAQVHDSLVAECLESDAEDVALILQDAMENTTHLEGIRFEAIPKIGKTLADV